MARRVGTTKAGKGARASLLREAPQPIGGASQLSPGLTDVKRSTKGMNESSIISERRLTLEEAADYLQLPRRTLRELCEKKKICHSRLDYRRWRFRKSDLDAYLDVRTVQPVVMP